MSIDLVASALWLDMEPHQKLVLISLCENADESGRCWPGRLYIAARSSLSPRRVSDHLRNIEEAGYMRTLERGRGPGQPSVRILNVSRIVAEGRGRYDAFRHERYGDDSSPIAVEMVTEETGDGDTCDRDGDTPRLRNLQIKTSKEPSHSRVSEILEKRKSRQSSRR